MRIVPELRAVHIERHRLGTPAELLYLDTNYDLAGTALADGIRRVSLVGALRRFATTPATTLEVPEPLWMRFWPKHFALVVGFKSAGALRGRQHRVVTYAMENNTLAALVGGRHSAPAWIVRIVATLIGITARASIDRICFASATARDTYAQLPFVSAIEHTIIPELPRATPTPTLPTPCTCVFVGAMEDRKGVHELMDAWPAVETMVPDARLIMVGPGPLHTEATAWAASSPESRHVAGRLPHSETTTLLQTGSVLVAPSKPDGRWKEQIGLPIKEALAAGLTVITTDQTGLAPWLTEHGHTVLPLAQDTFRDHLATAIADALRAPLDRDQVRAALPVRDGRLSADIWLHTSQEHPYPTPTHSAGAVA